MQEKGKEILNKRSENTIDPERLKLNIELENLVSNEGILTGDINQQSNSSSIFRKNDILFGRLRPYLNKWWYATDDGVKSGEIWAIYPKEPNHSLFIYYLIQTERFLYFANISSGTRMPRASWEIITDKTFLIPAPNEQKMIARLLHNLEKIITLEQEKSHYLRKIYKDLVQLLLIADETKSPKIRLKGYSAKWELTRVSDIFEITRGKVLAKEEVSDIKTTEYKYPVYSSQTLNHGLMGYYNEYLFENAITWTTDGANAGTVNLRSGKFYSTNVNGVLLSDEGFACKAVAEIINNTAYKYVSHVGNPKLMNNVMADIPIYIPNDPKELEALSPIFINLEYKITLVENIISKYKSIRTYLLNNLFV